MNEYTATFKRIAPRTPGMLYEPAVKGEKSRIGIIAMHPDGDYLDHSIGANLASRGYTVLCANTHSIVAEFPDKIRDVANAYAFLESQPGIEKIVLMGHSGGATLMSAYQNLAENGVKTFQGPEMIIKAPDFLDGLKPAAGFLSLDSNWGNGAMRLFGTDPAVVSEEGEVKIDPELDMFNPANGWTPEGAHYSDEFLKKFFRAQHERNERIIRHALDRLAVIEAGKGFYADDEPLTLAGASFLRFNNKLFPQDPRLLSHTKEVRPQAHKDGVITNEIVYTVRKPGGLKGNSRYLNLGALKTTVKDFLSSVAVHTTDDYHYDEQECFGIDFDSCYCCTCGNVKGVTVPAMVMGMTAGWEFSAVETIYNNLGSKDKSCMFIEGATHDFWTDKACEKFDGQFGDTLKTTYDIADKWLAERFL